MYVLSDKEIKESHKLNLRLLKSGVLFEAIEPDHFYIALYKVKGKNKWRVIPLNKSNRDEICLNKSNRDEISSTGVILKDEILDLNDPRVWLSIKGVEIKLEIWKHAQSQNSVQSLLPEKKLSQIINNPENYEITW